MRPGAVPCLVAVLSACAMAPVAGAPSADSRTDPRFAPIRQMIEAEMTAGDLPSVAIAVVAHGRIVWEEGFGWADRERGVRATARTPYSLASVSKPVTATAIMRFVEQDALDLSAPANAYLRGVGLRAFVGREDEATVERLLTHTAGLPTHYRFFYAGEDAALSLRESVRRYGIVAYPPGERSVYSNLGYGVLQQVLEHVSGLRYATLMAREVFRPLGMRAASVDARPGEAGHAARYGDDGRPLPVYAINHGGASALSASAHDLARFALFHLQRALPDQQAILEPRSIRRMQQPHAPAGTDSPGQWRGYGWMLRSTPAGFLHVWHTGSMPGVASVLSLYPNEGVGVAVLVNRRSSASAIRIAGAAAEAVLPIRPLLSNGLPAAPAPRVASRPPRALAGRWSGSLTTWEAPLPFVVEIRRSGEVTVRLGDRTAPLEYVRWSDGTLTGQVRLQLPSMDKAAHPHALALTLARRSERMTGWATAVATSAPLRFALSSWLEVSRER